MTEDTPTELNDFLDNVKDHTMTVEMDHGVNRSLLFKSTKEGWNQHFRIVTWKGGLSITGDMGSGTFERMADMFEFFRNSEMEITPSYYHEKQTADSRHHPAETYNEDKFKQYVKNEYNTWFENYPEASQVMREELWDELYNEVIPEGDCEHEARRAISDFHWKKDGFYFQFTDEWEIDFKGYTHGFIWRLYAVVWAVNKFDEYKAHPLCATCADTGLRNRYESGIVERICPHPTPCMKCDAGHLRLNLKLVYDFTAQMGAVHKAPNRAPMDALKNITEFFEKNGILKTWEAPEN